jgi:hypothetical protein
MTDWGAFGLFEDAVNRTWREHVTRWSGGLEILDGDDVDVGAANEPFCDPVRVDINANVHGGFFDEGQVVIDDVVVRSVGQAEAEWFERLGPEEFADLFRFDHAPTVAGCFPCYNPAWTPKNA